MKQEHFFMVYCPINGPARVQHNTLEEAKTEAKRLAEKHPNLDFYILATIGRYRGYTKIEAKALCIEPTFIVKKRRKR